MSECNKHLTNANTKVFGYLLLAWLLGVGCTPYQGETVGIDAEEEWSIAKSIRVNSSPSVQFSNDGTLIACLDESLRIFDSNLNLVSQFETLQDQYYSCEFIDGGSKVLLTGPSTSCMVETESDSEGMYVENVSNRRDLSHVYRSQQSGRTFGLLKIGNENGPRRKIVELIGKGQKPQQLVEFPISNPELRYNSFHILGDVENCLYFIFDGTVNSIDLETRDLSVIVKLPKTEVVRTDRWLNQGFLINGFAELLRLDLSGNTPNLYPLCSIKDGSEFCFVDENTGIGFCNNGKNTPSDVVRIDFNTGNIQKIGTLNSSAFLVKCNNLRSSVILCDASGTVTLVVRKQTKENP